MKEYFRINAVIKRVKLLPKLILACWHHLVNGIPYEATEKYEGDFQKIYNKRNLLKGVSQTKDEVYTLYSSLLATSYLKGSIAEVGVYKGGSAKILAEMKGEKSLYLFDTFEGMPNENISLDKDDWEKDTHQTTSLDEVKTYLDGYDNVHFLKGFFPDSIRHYPDYQIEKQSFSFVHLDVDLYKSTLDCLEFFYKRMVPFGRLISHNYNLSPLKGGNTPGVKRAFMEFFKHKEYLIIEIAETQCMVIKPATVG